MIYFNQQIVEKLLGDFQKINIVWFWYVEGSLETMIHKVEPNPNVLQGRSWRGGGEILGLSMTPPPIFRGLFYHI